MSDLFFYSMVICYCFVAIFVFVLGCLKSGHYMKSDKLDLEEKDIGMCIFFSCVAAVGWIIVIPVLLIVFVGRFFVYYGIGEDKKYTSPNPFFYFKG